MNEANNQNEEEFEEAEEEIEYKSNASKIRPEEDEQLVVSNKKDTDKLLLYYSLNEVCSDTDSDICTSLIYFAKWFLNVSLFGNIEHSLLFKYLGKVRLFF